MRLPIIRRLASLRQRHAPSTQPWQVLVAQAQQHLLQPIVADPSAPRWLHLPGQGGGRGFAAEAQHSYSHEVDEINSLFVEARDEIAYAAEDSETVYFDESVAEAKTMVDKCLSRWAALLDKLPDAERARVQRSMGLKIEQLKAEYAELAATHS